MQLYIYNCFINYYPDDDPLGSKNFAVKITKHKEMFTVFTN